MGKFTYSLFRAKAYALYELCLSLLVIIGLAILLFVLAVACVAVVEAILAHWAFTRTFEPIDKAIAEHDGETLTYIALAASYLSYVAVGLSVAIVARLRGGFAWRELIAWGPWSFWLRRRLFWLLVAATLAYSFAADFMIAYFAPETREWLTIPEDRVAAALVGILVAGFAPVVEELVFRGWIFTNLRRNFSFAATLLASSAIFAGLHYDSTHIYALAVFPVGLALGAMREMTGSVKAAIALHALNNFIAVCLSLPD